MKINSYYLRHLFLLPAMIALVIYIAIYYTNFMFIAIISSLLSRNTKQKFRNYKQAINTDCKTLIRFLL